jgi:hypothetical protein
MTDACAKSPFQKSDHSGTPGSFEKPDYGVQLLMSKDSADAGHDCTVTNLYVVEQRNFRGIAFADAALS